MPSSTADKFCIIGAGSSGLAAAKNFLAAGIPFDCLERQDDVGGNWHYGSPASSVYASTHLISSKRLTEYTDFPMPEEWPEYPSHELALEYFRSYARRFGLYERIEFGTGVEQVEFVDRAQQHLAAEGPRHVARGVSPWNEVEAVTRSPGGATSSLDGVHDVAPAGASSENSAKDQGLAPLATRLGPSGAGKWRVTLTSGEVRYYRGVVIANGHNWDPRWPEYPGTFAGEVVHSRQYKTPELLRGRRVLVVGGGNSGCDLAVEAAIHAKRALWSTRRAYPILPKFFRGRPIDQCGEIALWLRAPLWARRLAGAAVSHLVLGPAWRTGVPRPDHKLFESHPIINSQIHHHVGHGNLELRPDIQQLDGSWVRFVDGREEEVDLIIYATGYRITFPFIADEDREPLLNWHDGAPRLFLHVFHPVRDDLFCAGLIQPASGQWGLVDLQMQLVARYVTARDAGATGAARFDAMKAREAPDLGNGVKYLGTPRHAVEVEYYSYRKRLRKLIATMDRGTVRRSRSPWPVVLRNPH
ncbi:MAG TPA: NAD(P)-binding domain-containing protein [Lacipirellulaceae bacterium]|nr:NAD(P)-binding domain-containing protein [Lacipirellulaceae bacterium]